MRLHPGAPIKMLDILKNQLRSSGGREERVNLAREFLQLLALKIIYDNGYFKNLAFVGGTALRILYKIRRFSEDLDFSLVDANSYATEYLAGVLERNLTQYGFRIELAAKKTKTVHNLELRFKELLFALGLSPLKSQKLMIKLDIDTNPPKGHKLKLSLVNEMSFLFSVTHFDLASMYATKLHACFYRTYTKGRDIYDLIWYLGRGLLPNFPLLNNAIEQTQHIKLNVDRKTLKAFLIERIDKIDFPAVKRDVERFLIDKSELKLFDKTMLRKIIESKNFGD